MYVLNIFKNLTKINDVLFVYFCGRLHEKINNIPGGVPILKSRPEIQLLQFRAFNISFEPEF